MPFLQFCDFRPQIYDHILTRLFANGIDDFRQLHPDRTQRTVLEGYGIASGHVTTLYANQAKWNCKKVAEKKQRLD